MKQCFITVFLSIFIGEENQLYHISRPTHILRTSRSFQDNSTRVMLSVQFLNFIFNNQPYVHFVVLH
jgi:hypothetical protein